MRTKEQAACAFILATLLFAGVAPSARGDGCLSAAEAASALRCDEHLAALATATTLCNEETPAQGAGSEVSRSAGVPIAGAARAVRAVRAARASGSPPLHTAAHAHPLHHRLHHGALAMRHAGSRHVTPELHAHRETGPPAGSAPVPAAPARESHPRAALPVLVRPAHHVSWGGGGRLAAALPRASWALPVSATAFAAEEDARVTEAGHEANEARGPPEAERLTLTPPASTRSDSSLPRAHTALFTSDPPASAQPSREADRALCCSRASIGPGRDPVRRIPFASLSRRCRLAVPTSVAMESATAFPSGLSAGGVS